MNNIWKKASHLTIALTMAGSLFAIPAFAQPNKQNQQGGPSLKRSAVSTFSVPSEAIIDNGTVQLGIHAEGHLNVYGGTISMPDDSTSVVGLRYIPTNGEATAPGCLCEGWGVADAASGISGSANAEYGIFNLAVSAGTGITATSGKTKPESVGSAFKSVVTTGEGQFKVTHDYKPSASPNLYEVEVTVENTGTQAVNDLRYRRVMDWDIAPNTFEEYVALHVGNAADVIQATTDGFMLADPLSDPGPYAGNPPTTLTPGSPDFMSAGYVDQGALFDFGFGKLNAGAKKTFKTYYGAAENREQALMALSKVGAEVYSFGIPSDSAGNAALNGPHIFIFAFGAVGGVAVDTIAPTTTLVPNPLTPNGMNGWYKTPVNVSFTATDNVPGSGVDKTLYRVNGGAWTDYTAPFTLTTDGIYTVEYYSKDKAGNIETIKSATIKIDKTTPITKYGFTPITAVSPAAKTYISGFTVKLTATDNLSTVTGTVYRINGSAWTPYTSPFNIHAATTQTVEYFSTDVAGNNETPNLMDFVKGIFTGNK